MSATLIVGPSWVGDMVMAQSLFKVLKQQQPEAAIDVLAPAWSRALLNHMDEVRDAITMPLGHGQLAIGDRYRLGKRLREKQYQWVIVLPNSLKSALVPFWARIPHRTGYLGEARWGLLNDARHLDKQRLPMTVQRFVALGLPKHADLPDPLPSPQLTVRGQDVTAALHELQLSRPATPLLALCPGAEYGPAKRWPSVYFAEVARAKLAQGWQVWVFGSDKDSAIAQAVCDAAGEGCINLAGRTRLEQAIDLLSLATIAVSNDSGLMHVASALGVAVIALYGSSDPGFTPPLSDRARIVSLGLECSPCFKRECPLGHLRCLKDLLPAQVLAAMAEFQ